MTEEIKKEERTYISFSELLLFEKCPYKHYLTYTLKQREPDSIFTVFGTCVHGAIERKWKYKVQNSWIGAGKLLSLFCKYNDEDPRPWIKSAFRILKDFFPWMEENFPECELYDIEFKLEEPIKDFERKFLGYIDLILYNKKEDIYHILDLKTAGWGWNQKQLSDTKKLYQVVLYKKFFCDKTKIEPSRVKCHYLLLLRNPPKKTKYAITLHSVTSGDKKVQNAIDWMYESIEKMKAGSRLKSPTTCDFCVCGLKKK